MISGEDPVPNLPKRLRELRQEMGWTLDDVANLVGVTQRGVVSNWEATNHRRRIPPIGTLLILQRWYGVSFDYLLGNPDAERDSPAVKTGRRLVRERLRRAEGLDMASPSDRARVAVAVATEVAQDAFFSDRIAAHLNVTADELAVLQLSEVWPDQQVEELAELLGIRGDWFYVPEPVEVLNTTEGN